MATFYIYRDSLGQYRWRLRAPNNKIIADSAEGYTTLQGAKDGIADVKYYAGNASVQVLG